MLTFVLKRGTTLHVDGVFEIHTILEHLLTRCPFQLVESFKEVILGLQYYHWFQMRSFLWGKISRTVDIYMSIVHIIHVSIDDVTYVYTYLCVCIIYNVSRTSALLYPHTTYYTLHRKSFEIDREWCFNIIVCAKKMGDIESMVKWMFHIVVWCPTQYTKRVEFLYIYLE